MIEITDKRKCSGCRACEMICPINIISFTDDEEGFAYPVVDKGRCISCGQCIGVCPMLKTDHGTPADNKTQEITCYAAQLKEKEALNEVSSGGAFWALAQQIIQSGGIVYGVKQKDIDYIYHDRALTIEDARQFRRSKYLESDVRDVYTDVKRDLIKGLPVLFTGTGCQVAGLNCYLGKRYDNLYTCEVICHGIPSKKVWKQYRDEKEKLKKSHFKNIIFRDKSFGWSQNHYRITYDNGSVEIDPSGWHPFHRGYLKGLFSRPSCGDCPFSSLPRVADITLADYWKYSGRLRLEHRDLGVSLVVINNPHGEALLKQTAGFLETEPTDRKLASYSCRHLTRTPMESPYRERFMREFKTNGYHRTLKKYARLRIRDRLRKLYILTTRRKIGD